jgi:hypothetical protein
MLKKLGFPASYFAVFFALVIGAVTIPRARKLDSPDFKVFYTAARHMLDDPTLAYRVSPDRYLYPPSTALLFVPFAFSENYSAHRWSWHALLAVLVGMMAGTSWAALAAMAILSRYLAITFGYGQVNLVVMALLWMTAHRLRGAMGGAGWALATSIKVYPAIFAPAFWRCGRAPVVGALALGLALLALPFLCFGFSTGVFLYAEFLRALGDKGLPLHSHNQSLAALLSRLFTEQDFYLHAVGGARWTLVALPEALVRAIAWAVGGGIAALSWWRAFRRDRGGADLLAAAAFSIIFLSHIVWKDYMLWLFFPLAVTLGRLRKPRAWALAVAYLALVLASSPDLLGHVVSTRLDAACIHLWGAVLVWGAWWKA